MQGKASVSCGSLEMAVRMAAGLMMLDAAQPLLRAAEAIVSEEDRLVATGECLTELGDLIQALRVAIAKTKGI